MLYTAPACPHKNEWENLCFHFNTFFECSWNIKLYQVVRRRGLHQQDFPMTCLINSVWSLAALFSTITAGWIRSHTDRRSTLQCYSCKMCLFIPLLFYSAKLKLSLPKACMISRCVHLGKLDLSFSITFHWFPWKCTIQFNFLENQSYMHRVASSILCIRANSDQNEHHSKSSPIHFYLSSLLMLVQSSER